MGRCRLLLTAAALHLCLITGPSPLGAAETDRTARPWISIIIDDIGYRRVEDYAALHLPGPIAYAIMPHSPHGHALSRLAGENGKEVLLHLPMEAVAEEKNRFLGPGALMLDMTRRQFVRTLLEDLQAFPNIIGVNNHMGSLITRHPGHMQWLMESLRENDFFYIDSLTSRESVAHTLARENDVPYMRRDIFLDNEQDTDYISDKFDELIRIARKRGRAIAIGHPHPETIAVLNRRLPQLDGEGVTLISLERMIRRSAENGSPLRLSLQP